MQWLEEKHNIVCKKTEFVTDCTLVSKDMKLERKSRASRYTALYTKITERFEDEQGNQFEIISLGMFNRYYDR